MRTPREPGARDDRRPTYWEYDATDPLDCRACGWSGTTIPESHDAFLDVRCPECDAPILKISWPSTAETRAAAEAGNAGAARELVRVEQIEARWAEAARTQLERPDQLPVIDAGRITITWDFEEARGEHWTVLRHEGLELFRELAYWEGIERFVAVVGVLEQAYGGRLRAVEPTPDSTMYLWGDRLGAPSTVEGINERLGRGPRRGRFGRGWPGVPR